MRMLLVADFGASGAGGHKFTVVLPDMPADILLVDPLTHDPC
jgi:hypothetical protein